MIDWLRRDDTHPSIELAGREVPIALNRHARAKRLILRLSPDGSEVRVTLPRWGTTREALGFVQSRKDWLEEQARRIEPSRSAIETGEVLWRGQNLALDWSASRPRRIERDGRTLLAGGPQSGLENRLRRWLEGEALALFEKDLRHYAPLAGVPVPQVRLSRAKRRWGSCSSDGTVRLNWRLVQAPDSVRRSVVAHEVAHLVHFDHSPAFHKLLGELFGGDLPAANNWLKSNGRSLYSVFG